MLDRRLIGLVPGAMRRVLETVLFQLLGLACDIALAWCASTFVAGVVASRPPAVAPIACLLALAIAGKAASSRLAGQSAFLASRDVRRLLREQVFAKLLRLGPDYAREVPTAEVVQLAVEGTEQLETYFGRYLPQLAYSVVAPLVLFLVLLPVSWASGLVLLVFVPLIPLVIVAVQKVAKRTMGAYWDEYANLGDTFLESLQGLPTLKVFSADARRHEQMNQESERFRVATMRVLRMQLNSIVVMDVVALGGAAAGMCVALSQLAAGTLSLFGCLMVVLLSASFFIPMRTLGSYFHVAMNGMAASRKIFRLLDLPEPHDSGTAVAVPGDHLAMSHVSFSYGKGLGDALGDVSLDVPAVGLTGIVGKSGSGKSTVASLLSGRQRDYRGSLMLGGKQLRDFSREALARYVTVVPTNAYLFRGTVRDNLQLGDPTGSDERMWEVLASVRLADYLCSQDGLDTRVEEEGQNLSGGQRQRLALARALMHNSPVYVLDEATSNVDAESEDAIMDAVRGIARYKAVVVISHRLANVTSAHRIYVMESGHVVGAGTHDVLLGTCPQYRELWDEQSRLEHFDPVEFAEEEARRREREAAAQDAAAVREDGDAVAAFGEDAGETDAPLAPDDGAGAEGGEVPESVLEDDEAAERLALASLLDLGDVDETDDDDEAGETMVLGSGDDQPAPEPGVTAQIEAILATPLEEMVRQGAGERDAGDSPEPSPDGAEPPSAADDAGADRPRVDPSRIPLVDGGEDDANEGAGDEEGDGDEDERR
ncbi:MAG: ABC transporter ATP-binding protein/permease [Olsenella sp.]|nr:ABC transporter ATP-binding protein/permease [Olsenella sp.]